MLTFSLQVQQSVHNSFYNTTTFDPTYAALKGITSAKGADGVIYGALASQVYGSVADQVYQEMANHNAPVAIEEGDPSATPDPTTLFEAARAKFFQEGQKVGSLKTKKKSIVHLIELYLLILFLKISFNHKYSIVMLRYWQSSRQEERQQPQKTSETAARSEGIERPSFPTLFQVPLLK